MIDNRGSEWLKWDLHFHTPSSYDYKDKSVTNQQIVDVLVNAGVSVVAITDHHIINVEQIKELQLFGKDKVTFLPGIEFCSELGGSESIHFIGIFPENSEIESIWTKLQGKCNLTLSDISDIGGYENIQCDLIQTCDLIHELGGITSIHAGTKTNTIENIRSTILNKMQQKKRILSDSIDILEVGKEENVDDYAEKVFPSIGFKMPVVLCSDNHNIRTYEIKQNLWIKANPTFVGLKQILYEPEDRVKIQEMKPEEKSIYQVINSISLNENGFWKGEIMFNPNLNTIIGGRSTGKSTLIKAIAEKIDNKNSSSDDFVSKHLEGISINWQDREESSNRDIDFFRQSYMHDIANSKEETNNLIKNIIRNKDENKYLEEYSTKNESIKKSIAKNILEIFQIQADIKKYQLALREKGFKQGVESEIKSLNSKIDDLSKNGSVSQEELEKYKILLKNITDKELIISQADNDLKLFQRLKITTIINSSYPEENKFDSFLLATNSSELKREFTNITLKTDKEWLDIVCKFIYNTENIKNQCLADIDQIKRKEIYLKGTKYYNDNKELNDIHTKLKEESNKFQSILQLEKQISSLKIQKNTLLQNIASDHETYKNNTQYIVEQLSIQYDGIDIKVVMEFNKDGFRNFLESRLNQRGSERQVYLNNMVEQYSDNISIQVADFLSKALENTIEYKNYNTNQNVVSELLTTNWFDISYNLTYQNDVFSEMSEGKQAFVILKLLLDFSTKKCPILIDQPEDSLDNRAIYNELVRYIKNKKKERQIILVTHNPNVVVSADAENIIVANQNGNNSLNVDCIKFQYINGALENTKLKNSKCKTTLESQGIREHVCEILEGGREAFEKREQKYGFK